jgi:hypothetical protein
MNTTTLQCDVLVAGGGPAGVPCAIAAARQGASVILVHDRPVLGGNASSEVRMHIVGADWSGSRATELQTEAREGGIIEEIRLETAVRNPQRSASMLDLILYEKVRTEPNLRLMLNTTAIGVEMDGRTIRRAIAERQSTEDRFVIDAKMFIDCTGDGRLGAEAGAPFCFGREDKQAYGESLAPDHADKLTLGSSLLFQARKYDRPMPFVAPPWARTFSEDDLKLRSHATNDVDRGLEYGYWWVEWGGQLDTIKDNETIRDELLAIMLGVWDHIKNQPGHGAENWALQWFGFLPGKRESRRFIGKHMLTESDVMRSVPQPDAIAFGGWPIDLHPCAGVDAPDEPPCSQHGVPHLFDIPLRSCVSRDVDNLMFAGRNISASHIAFASTRVMATCAAVGQGVGTAAAHAVKHDLSAGQLCERADMVEQVQQSLLRDDCYLVGCKYFGEHQPDSVAASSHQPGGEPSNILTGQTRSVHGSDGAPADRSFPGTHRWMSDPVAGLPATLELVWNEPINVQTIELIFDTGMHRALTLSHSDAYVARMRWGRSQPETVRDYTIELWRDGKRIEQLGVDGNYQRRRVHQIAGHADALRITVAATNGIDHARLFDVRVFG